MTMNRVPVLTFMKIIIENFDKDFHREEGEERLQVGDCKLKLNNIITCKERNENKSKKK